MQEGAADLVSRHIDVNRHPGEAQHWRLEALLTGVWCKSLHFSISRLSCIMLVESLACFCSKLAKAPFAYLCVFFMSVGTLAPARKQPGLQQLAAKQFWLF